MAALRILTVVCLLQAAFAAGQLVPNMYEEWNNATRDARRAFLAGSLEEMKNIREVVAQQGEELKSLLGNVKIQLSEKAESSNDVSAAFKIVNEQLKDVETHHTALIGQANQNLDTVKALVTAQAEASGDVSWDNINKKLASLLDELKNAGKKE